MVWNKKIFDSFSINFCRKSVNLRDAERKGNLFDHSTVLWFSVDPYFLTNNSIFLGRFLTIPNFFRVYIGEGIVKVKFCIGERFFSPFLFTKYFSGGNLLFQTLISRKNLSLFFFTKYLKNILRVEVSPHLAKRKARSWKENFYNHQRIKMWKKGNCAILLISV